MVIILWRAGSRTPTVMRLVLDHSVGEKSATYRIISCHVIQHQYDFN